MKRLLIVFCAFSLSPFCALCESAPISPSTPVPSTPVVATDLPPISHTDTPTPATATFTPVPPTLTPTAASAEIGPIAFVSDRDGNLEIYTIFPDGSNLWRITDNPASDYHPSWSADGQQIAFTSERDGYTAIYVMNADGSNQRAIARGWNPFWSPDGHYIAYHAPSASPISIGCDLHIILADGSGDQAVTTISTFGDSLSIQGWMDDSTHLLVTFTGMSQGVVSTTQCWIDLLGNQTCGTTCYMEVGNDETTCPPGYRLDYTHWVYLGISPDRTMEAVEDPVDGQPDIWLVDFIAGHRISNVTNHPANDTQPAWSPAGAEIPLVPPATQEPLPTPTNPVRLWVESSLDHSITINGVIRITQGPWVWDWGDGTITEGWFPQTHIYAECGTYFITVYTPDYQYFNTLPVSVCDKG